jgi:hypothetical protein
MDPVRTDPVAAAFARLGEGMQAMTPPEAQYHAGTRLTWSLGATCNGLLALGILLAIAGSTYAFLNL